jgi:hypothetical protein
MNDPFDRLEAELSTLKPHDASPELKQRIANELETDVLVSAKSRERRIWWSGAMAGGLVAACLAIGLLLRPAPVGKPETESPLPPLQVPVAAAFDDALPTVWTYRRALTRSPQELDALLDRHAALAAPRGARTSTHLFIRFDSELLLNGEL